ncbi:UDP-L-arabinose 4-epimerase [Rhodospirillales bacterium URHD0017]|nr:UDP-L-arabinose 4-epimerase [Rhodospirillales bacterium URHD0017]
MRVLVVGGAGYIGSHACKALAEAGHMPVVYDNLRIGHKWAVKWGPLEPGEINDAATLTAVMRRHRPDAVMNFAAYAYVGESNNEPTRYYRNNVGGMLTLIEVMQANDVRFIVFSSSCATYGVPSSLPIGEAQEQKPINPYGRSKLMGEMMLRDACAAYGLGAVALRYFNAAGADAEGSIGEEHDPEPHLIPLVLQAAAERRPNITVFGDDYDTDDGTCIRDYVHVTDLAWAHVAALAICEPGRFSAYNLGTGKGCSINELIGQARSVTGKRIAMTTAPRRAGDPPNLVADSSAARTALKWSPVHSDMGNIIETAWRWMTDHRNKAIGG